MQFDDDFVPSSSRADSGADSGPGILGRRFRDDPQARRPDPAFARIRAYWEALRSDGQIPARSQINPRGLESALDRAFMLEQVAPGVARVRLAGTHATALMGMEVRGMPLSALITPDSRDALAEALRSVFEGPAIAEITLDASRSIGRPALSGRMLILPLRGEDGRIDRALGCLAADGVIGRTPRRFDIVMTRLTTVGERAASDRPTGRVEMDPAPLPDPEPTAMAGFSEPRTTFHTRPRPPTIQDAPRTPAIHDAPRPPASQDAPRPPARGRPHLRLVKTDRDG